MERCRFAPVYKVTKDNITDEEHKTYISYGISCRRKDILGLGDIMREIKDISTNREMVKDMVDLFNKYCLSPDCFGRAVVDIIS